MHIAVGIFSDVALGCRDQYVAAAARDAAGRMCCPRGLLLERVIAARRWPDLMVTLIVLQLIGNGCEDCRYSVCNSTCPGLAGRPY